MRGKFVVKMATKKSQVSNLIRPSEFLVTRKDGSKGKSAAAFDEKIPHSVEANLIRPSQYALAKNVSNIDTSGVKIRPPSDHAVSHESGRPGLEDAGHGAFGLKHDSSNASGRDEVNVGSLSSKSLTDLGWKQQAPEIPTKLLSEIQSCKEQNQRLHQELGLQLKKLVEEKFEDKVTPSLNPEKLDEALLQLHKNQDRSVRFYDLMESKVQKQAEIIERMTQQFLDHQAELNAGNEKLSRKLLRIQEEHRDSEMHLEKQLGLKEKQCHDFKQSLQKVEEELEDLKAKTGMEMSKLKNKVQLKDELIANLQLEIKTKDERYKDLLLAKERELTLLNDSTVQEIQLLKEASRKYKQDCESQKKAVANLSETLVEKNKEIQELIKAKDEKIAKILIISDEKDAEMKKLIASRDEEMEKLAKDKEVLRSELQKRIYHLEDNCCKIQSEFEQHLSNAKEYAECLKLELLSKSNELEKSIADVKYLQTCIAEKELESSSKDLKLKVRIVEDENAQLKETCKSLESVVELLNVRLLSLNNIIKIQETEFSKDDAHLVGEKSARILSKWRDKVYSLLVQLKSHKILENEEISKLEKKVTCFQTQSQEQRSMISLLENQLMEKKAENEMKNHKLSSLSKEISLLEGQCCKQNDHNIVYRECFDGIKFSTTALDEKVTQDLQRLQNGFNFFRSLEGRLSFAYKRLNTIQDLFQRKEAIRKSNIGNSAKDESENEELSVHERHSLVAEVKILTEEREVLLGKIKADTEKMEKFQTCIEAEYKMKLDSRDSEIERLGFEVEKSRNEFDELKGLKGKLEVKYEELQEEAEALKLNSGRLASNYEKDLTQKLASQKELFREEISKMENVISDTKKDHTKAVISLQQLERQMQWQKHNNEEQVKENEELFSYEVAKLSQKARELEKERNILLTTIKQENMKMPSLKHVGLQLSAEKYATVTADKIQSKRKHKGKPKNKIRHEEALICENQSAQLSVMLKELQSISASLLEEDDITNKTGGKEPESCPSEEL